MPRTCRVALLAWAIMWTTLANRAVTSTCDSGSTKDSVHEHRIKCPGAATGPGSSDLDELAFHVATSMVAPENMPCSNQLSLIYEPAGGWGDQLRGIVTVSYVALMTCKTFRIHWTHEFALENYFETEFERASADDVRASNKISAVNHYDYFG